MTLHSYTLPDRAVLQLTGPDTREFLRGLVTQSLTHLTPETPVYSLLLTPQGKIIADCFLTEKGEVMLLECSTDVAEALTKKLTLYKLRARVEIEDVSELWTSVAMWGDEERIDKMIAEAPPFLHVYRDPRLPALGVRVLGPTKAKPDLPHEVSRADWNAHRLSHGIPLFGEDFVSEQMFPMDANMDALNAVDYKKGCFVGQEVASRMKRKGEVRKRMLTVVGEALSPGAEIKAGETTLGTVTSCEGGRGLALIRLDRWDKAEAAPEIEGTPVTITKQAYLG